ncbi:MAG: YihY/virulence factor BrkB family protein [Bacteroidales bacterium]
MQFQIHRKNPKKIIHKIRHFFRDKIWEIEASKIPFYKRYGINIVKVIILAFNGFKKDECPIRSSALTYFSLLSIVPVIAVGFAIAKGFGLEALLEEEIRKNLASQQEVMEYLLKFSNSILNSTKGGILAVISIGFLLYTVLRLFEHIESAVNTIWNIEKSRSFVRKFTDYLSIVLIAPILLVLAGTVNVYITTVVKDISKEMSVLKFLSPVILNSLRLSPYVIIWLLFTTMYIIMPNKRVKLKNAIFAGILAGTAYQLLQFYYINLQIGFSRYNAIYGSFAALPLFLIWMQLSWLIFLFGAEIASALDNMRSYGIKKDYLDLSQAKKRLLSILVLKKIVNFFSKGEVIPDSLLLANEIRLPVQYLHHITEQLVKSNLVTRVIIENEGITGFQPAKDIGGLSLAEVFERLDTMGDDKIHVNQDIDLELVNKNLQGLMDMVNINYSKVLIKDL